jgi:hypothetical protein
MSASANRHRLAEVPNITSSVIRTQGKRHGCLICGLWSSL